MAAYNFTKLKVLTAIVYLRQHRIPANLKTVAMLAGLTEKHSEVQLYRLKDMKYITASYDSAGFLGCRLKYKLAAKGDRVFNMLADRYEKGETMNLRRKGEPVEKSHGDLLPGAGYIKELMKIKA